MLTLCQLEDSRRVTLCQLAATNVDKLHGQTSTMWSDNIMISCIHVKFISMLSTTETGTRTHISVGAVYANDDPILDKGHSPHRLMQNINITETIINKLLTNLKPHKAAGPDRILTRILKECSELISPILLIIFRKSLNCGKIPQEWKRANICPVYKKSDKHDCINYRPMSLKCICCKLLEHIISKNIMPHIENNNILYDLQHGCTPSRSCETQLISFLKHISQSNNQNIQTDVVIMDFAKAFDKVTRQHLLYKLKYYGISCMIGFLIF